LRFILEHSLSPRLAEGLAALSAGEGHQVLHLRQLFPPNTRDEEWLRGLKERGEQDSVVITADPRIYRNPALKAAWIESHMTVFFLRSFADFLHREQAAKLVRWWPTIVEAARKAKPGQGFSVSVNGKVEALKPDA
jgi:hypothetical protein